MFGEAWEEMQSDKYKKLRHAAFAYSGCGITVTGVNDNSVIGEGMIEPIELIPAGTPFNDEKYLARVWSGHPDFGKKVEAAPVTPLGPAAALAEYSDSNPRGEDSSEEDSNPKGEDSSEEEALQEAIAQIDLPEGTPFAEIVAAAVELALPDEILPAAAANDDDPFGDDFGAAGDAEGGEPPSSSNSSSSSSSSSSSDSD